MSWSWSRTVDPVLPVVSLDEALWNSRGLDDQAREFEGYLASSVYQLEQYLGRGFLTQTWRVVLDDWMDVVQLPMAAPLQSVTSVKCYDTAGALTTLSSSVYDYDTMARPGELSLASGQVWPSLQADRLAHRVEIIYVVGYTDAGLVPPSIIQGVHAMVGAMAHGCEGSPLDAALPLVRGEIVRWADPACA